MLFISYSHKDLAIARSLHQCVLDHGYESEQIFRDEDERNGVILGQDWEEQLIKNLRGTRALIVLVSPAWLKSKWCFAELAFAKSNPHKPAIIPFVVRELSEKQWASSGLDRFQKPKRSATQYPKLKREIKLFVEQELMPFYPPDLPLQRHRESHPNSSEFKHISFDDWGRDPNMQVPLVLGSDQEAMMQKLEELLGNPTDAQHIHIVGESGTGKTRLVHEVLRKGRFQELVLYFDSPTALWNDPYFRELISLSSIEKAIVVVDDCLRGEQEIISRQVSKSKHRLRLITISYNDESPLNKSWTTIELKPLQTESISEIIGSYLHPAADVTSYAKMCNGSPRFAHLVGESLSRETSILALPNQQTLIERIISCGQDVHSEHVRIRLILAKFLAIFDRFGINPPHENEVKSISRLIRHFHPSIGLGDLLDAIKVLRNRRILQGKSTLYFSTPMLSLQLWRQWWEHYGTQFKTRHFQKLPPYLQNGLAAMLRIAPADDSVRAIATNLLKDPLLRDPNIFSSDSKSARRLLHSVADLYPNQTVEILWNCWTRWDLHNPSEQDVYSALHEFIKEIFAQAQSKRDYLGGIRLLEALAVADVGDKKTAIECLGRVFCLHSEKREDGFPYSDFLKYLEQLAESDCPKRQRLAVQICKSTIVDTTASAPSTIRYIDQIWKRISAAVSSYPETDGKLALVDDLGKSLCGLFVHPSAHSERLANIEWLTQAAPILRMPILKWIEWYWVHPHFQDAIVRNSLSEFYRRLISSDLRNRLEMLSAIVDRYDEDVLKPPVTPLIDYALEIDRLGRDLISCGTEALQLFESIVSSNFRASQMSLGRAIAINDNGENAVTLIVQAMSNVGEKANPLLLAGYLKQLREVKPEIHDAILEKLLSEPKHPNSMLRLVIESQPLTENTIRLVAELLSKHGADPTGLEVLGRDWLGKVEATQIHSWVRCCLGRNDLRGLNTACIILTRRYPESNFDGESATLIREIVSSNLIRGEDGEQVESNDELCHVWSVLFKWLVKTDIETCCGLAKRYWKAVSSDQIRLSYGRPPEEEDAVEFLVESGAQEAWVAFFEVMNTIERKGSQRLLQWLSRNTHLSEEEPIGHWARVPLDQLFDWIDRDPGHRIQDVCYNIPPLVCTSGIFQLTKEFLIRYWEQDTSCWDMVSDVQPGSWSGNLSGYYRKRISWIAEAQEKETNPLVANWLQALLASYVTELERSQETEEQEAERYTQ